MKGEERYLTNLLEGTKTRFVVPVYQRNYDWKTEQCGRLFDDIEDVVRQDRESHFFGSIVSKAERDVRVVIDGQQRITTTFLLLKALVTQAESGCMTVNDAQLTDRVSHEYLVDKYHKDEPKLKLKLVKDDQVAYERLFNTIGAPLVEDSNVTQNYRYFLRCLETTEFSADDILSGIERLMVIDITLGRDDDAQLIFESLNSTGLDLSEGDKIRNFILMGLDTGLQEQYYDQCWNPIEKSTDYDVSSFVRDWLAAKTRQTPNVNKVYEVFRSHVKKTGVATEDLLKEMLKYAHHYQAIRKAATGSPKIDTVLRRLNLLASSVVNPFLLNLLEHRAQGNISDAEVAEALGSVEVYLFRRWVCKVPTNALNKVFETLHAETERACAEGTTYCKALSYILLKKEGSGRMPSDGEFLTSLDVRNFYHIQNMKFYLYDRLENGDSFERVDVVKGLHDETLTVEHIMPQNLSAGWKADLGDDYESVHDEWLNRLANLTLTGYNSQYSNKRFLEKRDAPNGFKDSGLRMNKYVASCDTWGVQQLQERNDLLKADFLKLWPLPTSDFVPKNDIHEEHGLDEDFNFTNRKIAAYTFRGTRYVVKNWVEMICGVLSLVDEADPAAIRKYVGETEFPARYFSTVETDYCAEIGEGVYFNPGCSTETKCDILRRVLQRVGVEESELSFELYRSQEQES
jgi:uncharacterized protein with ParB-like and HNH nuclease domain